MNAREARPLATRLSAAALPGALVLAWVADAFAQRVNAPTLGSEFTAAALAIPLMAWGLTRQKLDRSRLLLLAIASLPVLLMAITSLGAASPVQTLLGEGPMWQGWILWASALGWFWVAVAAADGRDLMRVVRSLAWLGSAAALWTLVEAGGLLPTYHVRTGAAAMALFDSPNSLGQALALTIAATVSLAVRKNVSPRVRAGYAALVALQISALFAAGARTALLGVVMGIAAYGILENGRTGMRRAVHLASGAALVAFALGFGLVSAAWSGALGAQAFTRADNLLSGRFAIWNHVGERVAQHPLLGVGPAPFDSIIAWDVLSDGRIGASLTYDEHSILLTWLASTGLVGLVVFGLAAAVLGVHIVRSVRASNSTASARALAAGGVALFVSMLSSWPEPLALLGVSLVVGAFVSNGSLRGTDDGRRLTWRSPVVVLPAAGASIAALATLVALLPAVGARMTTANAADYPELVGRIERALENTHDYSYLTSELTLIERQGSLAVSDADAVDKLRRLASAYPPEAEGRVEIPLLALDILWERADRMSPEEFWELSRFYADKGIEASPTDGVWQYALARAAYTAHRSDASEYADAALASDLPDSAVMVVQQMR